MKVKIKYLPTQNEVNELDLLVATTLKGECVIGRSPDCDLPLDSPDVSRVHGKFFVQSSSYYYCDTGSRNGSIINNNLAEKNQPYILKHGDSIQIGDYILTMEDMTPAAEQLPETVFRVIDPALFSRPISDNLNVSSNNQVPEVVGESPAEVISQTPEEVAVAASDNSELYDAVFSEEQAVITASASPIADARTFVQPQDIATEEPEISESQENVDLGFAIAEERTFVQPRDLIQTSSSIDDLSTSDDSQDVDLSTPILQEYTTVQPRDIDIQPSLTISAEDVDLSTPILQEYTTVQPRDIAIPSSLIDSEDNVDVGISDDGNVETSEPEAAISTEEVGEEVITADVSSDAETSEPEAAISTEEAEEEAITADVSSNVETSEPEATISTEEVGEEVITADVSSNVETSEPEATISTEEVGEEVITADVSSNVETSEPEATISTEEVGEEVITADVSSNVETSEPEATISTEEVGEEVITADVTEAETLAPEAAISTEEIGEEAITTDVSSEVETLAPEAAIATEEVSDTPELVEQTPEEVAETEEVQTVENLEADTLSEPSQMIQKNIVLIAHESKKSELAELVAQNQEFFSQSLTLSWPSVSEVLKQQAGITVSEEIPSPTSGGYQKINLLLNSGDVSAVIFLRDFLTPAPSPTNEETLLRICNINQVLVATNLKTAEAIVHYLKHTAE
ncbi:FHA domain-containing protein [Anabaena azotica]|uniref:FHA domain-containing protein n=1 Tax=Anabaena azotica FACHB-119 TaxID=947527 RepID=A0ABR8DDN0_9NOST|nr:FHA domain-containing protein [Anabaena azotica]MBD2504716.1 FHA domain-containing protein [Anabaena azotica FACHB-119]